MKLELSNGSYLTLDDKYTEDEALQLWKMAEDDIKSEQLDNTQEQPVKPIEPTPQDPTGELTQFNKPVEQPSQATIAQMQAEANPKDTSDFSRGFKTSYEQLPELGYGLEAGAYAIGESAFGEGGMLTQGKQEAVAKMIEAQKETQANAKESDSFTYAYQKAKEGDFNALADTVQYGLGYGLGQMSQAIITGGLGSTVAKTAAETFAKEYTAKLVEQEALKVAEQTAARELTQEQIQQQAVKNVTESIANKGRDYALGAQAVGLEGGEILGDLAKQSTEQNRSLTAGEVTKGLGATALAAAGEFYADRFGLDILGGKRLSEAGKYTEGLKGNLLRGAATGVKGGFIEGGTEFGQTLVEEAGKGKDPFSSESFRQAIDAAALGSIGGGGIGAIGGALSPAQQRPDQPATGEIDPSMLSGGLPNSTAQTTAQQPAQTSSDWQRTMGDIRNIVGENQLVDNETIAKDIAGAENIDDAIQVFNHVGEAISTDHAITHEVATQEQLNIAAQRGNDQITGITEPLLQEPVKPKSDKLDATQESLDFIGQAVAQGGVELKGSMLYLPTGEKYSLNKAQRDHYNNLVTPTAETPIAQAPITMGEGTVETRQGQDQISGVEEPKTPVTVDLYRGVPKGASTEDTNATVGNSLFMTPTEQIAKDYAGKEGGVSKSTHTFNNLLEAATWAEAKSKVGLTQADTMETLVNTAREQGYDGITFTTKFNGKEYIVLKPNETKAVATPTADYETRNADRVTRIKEAATPEEAQSIYAEETSDNERHFEGTRKAEIAIKDTLAKLERESANKKEDEAYAAGEWVFHFPTNSLSDANQMAKSMEKIEPKNEYKVIPWQNDGYLVQKRNIEAASKLPKEKTGTIENPILRKNGKAFTSQQGAQTHIRTNPELSKETHTWVKLADEKYGIVTKDQVVSKATNPAANLRKVTGFENIVSMIGKLGGLSRVEMSERQLDDYKKNTSLFNNGVLSRTFDDMATVLRVDYGFSEIKTGDDLDTILKDSLRSKKPYYGYEGIDKATEQMFADKADQDQQEQDELLNTYTNEELNAILDAKTQAEKDQLMKDFKAEKKRKGDQEVDTVVDEMKGTGMTTSGDLFAPKIKEPIAKISKLERNLTEDEVATINELVFGSDEFLYLPASNKGILISKFNEYSKENPDKAKAYLTDLYNELYSEDDSNIKFSKAKAQERLAPNGKPSNLNATQYEQVRTPEFKAWFGDWENDPENASKVVDENGEPLVVYHGTDSNVNEFITTGVGKTSAAYFTNLPEIANTYVRHVSSTLYPVFLNIKKIVNVDANGANWNKIDDAMMVVGDYEDSFNDYIGAEYGEEISTDDIVNYAKKANDGAVIRNVVDMGSNSFRMLNKESDVYAVFNPNQIKSATGNTGEFSKESNDIRFSKDRAWDFKPMSDEMRQNLIDMGETDFVDRIDELENKVKTVADRAENHRLRLSHKDVLARIPELEKAAKKLKEGLITAYEYELLSEELLPMTPYEELPPISTEEEARYALANGKGQSEKKAAKYGLPMITFKNGEIVQLRLDIPSYSIHNKWVVSIHTPKSINGYNKQIQDLQNGTITPASDNSFKAGDSVGYQSVAIAKEVTFGMGEASALDIAEGSAKGTIATMMGKWEGTSIEEAKARAEEAMNSEEWVQVGMNPLKHSYFYDRDNLQPVIYADEVIQIGSLVLAKNPIYGRKSDFRFSQAQETADNHTEQSLKEGLTQAGDDAYGKGWTDRLLATGMFEIISALEANKIVGRGTMFHKAWHGSPHNYDKFDSSYMGTGEGAQAFGWGHYFTDAKRIAEWYREKLSYNEGGNSDNYTFKGEKLVVPTYQADNSESQDKETANQIAGGIVSLFSYGNKEITQDAINEGKKWATASMLKNQNYSDLKTKEIINALENAKPSDFEYIRKGKLYEVELAPTQEEYLDWNKPMSQQSDKVLESLKQWAEDSYPNYLAELEWKEQNFPNTTKGLEKLKSQTPVEWMEDLFNEPDYSGEDFYKELSEQVGYDEDASRYLNSMGIRGIRFKAEGGKSEDNNYVIFDDRDINIEAKYSMAGDIEAFFNPADGKTYFVAENIDKATDLHYLMMHEVGVHALNMGGNKEEFESILKQVDNLIKVKNPAALKGRQDALDADTPQEDLREETLAYLLKYAPKLKVVERFKAWLKNALRNMGKMVPAAQRLGFIQWANKLSDQDLLYIANATLRKAPELLLKKSSEYEVAQAQEYFDRTGFMPYLSEGQLEIPVELAKFAIKTAAQAKWGIHSVLGIPMNKNETVSLYYPTTNEIARRVLQEGKLVADNPNANRIYLTNESAGYSVMENRGAITNEMDGAVVLLQIDPSLVQIDDSVEHKDGRRDFFIPIGEGEAFMKKPKMLKLFTLNQPREQGIAETTTLAEVGERIAKAVEEYKGLTDRQKATRYTRAKKVLKRYHNITTFLTENRKLEKTRVGDYGLTYEGNSVASQGLGLASAQKINNKNLSTCPVSAICEELCLGETSGQNLLYGGKGKYRSGARLSQYLKTEAMVLHPEEFAIAIAHEIKLYESWANQTFEYVRDPANPKRFLRDPVTNDRLKIDKEIYQPAMRLNVTSDIPPTVFEPIMRAYPNVEFYDYTKLNSDSKLPNLHITYSSTGVSQIVDGAPIFNKHSNWRQSVQRLDTGFNVAMVFSDKNDMPKTVTDEATGKVYQVWNGDNYDARFLDPKRDDGIGMIVGLTNKDNTGGVEDATERTKGFFVNYNKKRDGDNVTILDQSKFNARAETYNGEKVTPSIKFSKSKKAKEGEIVNRSTGYTAYDKAKPIPEEVDNKVNYPEGVSLEEERDWLMQQLRRFDSFRRLNDKSNELINKYLTTMGRLPELGNYLGLRYQTLGKIDNVDDIVRNVFDTLQKATKEDSKEIYTYLTDNKATTEFIIDPQMALMAKDLKEAITIIGKKLVEFNIIPMESFQMYEGRYLPRVYLEHIIQSSDRYQSLGSGKTLSPMGYAKRRDNNLPEEFRRLIKGEIKNTAYLASRTLSIPLRDIAMMEFFNQISDNEKWVWKQSLINIELDAKTNRPTAIFDDDGVINYKATNSALEGKPKKIIVRKVTPYFLDKEADRILDQSYSAPEEDRKDMQDLAKMMKRAAAQAMVNMDAVPADFMKMPNIAKYGSLRGLVVHKLIYDDLVGTINTYGAAGEQTALENFFGNNGILAKITNAFKFSHVAINIPTQVTNLLSNGLLLHMSGVRFDKVPVRVTQAFKEVLNEGENYKKMIAMGGRKATFSNQELSGITEWLLENEAEFSDKNTDWFSIVHIMRELSYLTGKTVRGANNLHQNIEMVFKVAKFIDMKAKGANDETAAVMAHQALFDYSFIPRWAKWLRTVPMGIPFITWTIKSFEATLRTAANRPTTFLPYYMLGYAMSLAAGADFGDDGEDKLKAILKLLPERMQRGGSIWILPIRDDAGRTQLIDMKNLFPWGKTAEAIDSLSKLVGNQDVAELRNLADSVGVFSSPITQAVVAIDTNKDAFTGKQIVDENDPPAAKLQSILEYTYGMMSPPMLGGKGDIATLVKSQFPSQYEGIMNKDGSPKKTEQQAFIHLFTGLSIKSVDSDFDRRKKIDAFNNMITGIKAQRTRELRSNPNLSEESRRIVREKYDARIERVKEKKQKFKDETDVLK